jgi:hypothetical protein
VIDPAALQMVRGVLTGWLDRREREAIAYLIEENRLLRRQLGSRSQPAGATWSHVSADESVGDVSAIGGFYDQRLTGEVTVRHPSRRYLVVLRLNVSSITTVASHLHDVLKGNANPLLGHDFDRPDHGLDVLRYVVKVAEAAARVEHHGEVPKADARELLNDGISRHFGALTALRERLLERGVNVKFY